ncbi:MAG: SIS domain-containing protein [Clostridiales bacterium]|nr:SIS domain-containing protein [Clostridiales bacterium]HBM80776.1 phosphoheptose isomerase [Clostridiaceae bacterium]
MKDKARYYLEDLINRYPSLKGCEQDIERAFNVMVEVFSSGGKMLVCGNGGSAADSEHFIGELIKSFIKRREISPEEKAKFDKFGEDGKYIASRLQGALPAISIAFLTAYGTAYINKFDPDLVFAQQVYGLGKENDLLFTFSASGNSKNIFNAILTAKAKGMHVISITGESSGRITDYCDVIMKMPAFLSPAVQEYYLPVYHTLAYMLEEHFFEK